MFEKITDFVTKKRIEELLAEYSLARKVLPITIHKENTQSCFKAAVRFEISIEDIYSGLSSETVTRKKFKEAVVRLALLESSVFNDALLGRNLSELRLHLLVNDEIQSVWIEKLPAVGLRITIATFSRISTGE